MKHPMERSAGILPAGRGGRDGHAPFPKGARASCPQGAETAPDDFSYRGTDNPLREYPISNIHLRQGYGGQAEYPISKGKAPFPIGRTGGQTRMPLLFHAGGTRLRQRLRRGRRPRSLLLLPSKERGHLARKEPERLPMTFRTGGQTILCVNIQYPTSTSAKATADRRNIQYPRGRPRFRWLWPYRGTDNPLYPQDK